MNCKNESTISKSCQENFGGVFMDFKDLSYVLGDRQISEYYQGCEFFICNAADTYKISSESGVRAWSKAIPEAGSPFCPHLCRGTLCGKSIGDPEPKKRAGPGDERHRKEQLRLFKDCLSDHARHLHASLYPADFQFLISQRAPGNPGVAFLFTGRYAAEREADLAFFNLPVKSPDVDYEIISHEELLLILPHHHPLAEMGVQKPNCKYPWMDLKYLKDEPFLFQTPGQRTQQTVDQLFKATGITPIIKLQTSNIAAKVQLVAKGYGCGFVTETHLKHIQPPPDIACFSVGPETCTTVDFVAAYRRGSYLPYHAQEYIKIVKDFT